MCLSYLNLSDNNFVRIPTAVKLLSDLQHLKLHRNDPLQLEAEDAATLAALPLLHTCNLSKSLEDPESEINWTDSSIVALIAISKRLPCLKLGLSAE